MSTQGGGWDPNQGQSGWEQQQQPASAGGYQEGAYYPQQQQWGSQSGSPHRVSLTIDHQEHYSRGLAFLGIFFLYLRYIALIPILIVVGILSLVGFFVAWIMQFAVLITGRYPQGPHDFLTGILRWSVRMQAWLFGLTDKYPTSMQP